MRMSGTEKDCTRHAYATKLSDGAWIVIRRLGPADADSVVALHRALSQRERYLRFFTMQPVRLKALATSLTDGRDGDVALGAFEAGTLIGVANYVGCGKPVTAEVAVVVAHNDQLRGVGTALLHRLAEIARINGIRHLVADVLAVNHVLFRVLCDAGLQPRRVHAINGVVHIAVDLGDIATELDKG